MSEISAAVHRHRAGGNRQDVQRLWIDRDRCHRRAAVALGFEDLRRT